MTLPLTFACGDYDTHKALQDGRVKPDGIDLTILTDMDSSTRHWRFLRNREFDIAECSCSSYIVARGQGLPFRAIPVFPHRRFRHGFVFINTGKGIAKPADLIGKKIGVKSFQVTAVHWLRGILESEYGVPHTDLIEPFLAKDPRVARLFPDHKAEEIAYFRKTGIFPIMHVVAIRAEIVEAHPWIAINLYNALDRAKALAMQRMENPRMVPLAWQREAWEEQLDVLGPDPWENGLTPRNRNTLETLVRYSHEQGLTARLMPLDELFLDVGQGRKRGGYRV